MMIDYYKLIPRRTAIIHLSWFGALVLFAVAVILPIEGSKTALDSQIAETRTLLETQKNLQPLYQSLLKKSNGKADKALPMPEAGKLGRSKIATVPPLIQRLAKESGMEAISVSPDVNALAGQSKSLLVHAVVRGNFFDFRKLLIRFGGLPYLERIEEIQIQRDPDFMDFRLKIWLSLG
jgi:hypothetical protein